MSSLFGGKRLKLCLEKSMTPSSSSMAQSRSSSNLLFPNTPDLLDLLNEDPLQSTTQDTPVYQGSRRKGSPEQPKTPCSSGNSRQTDLLSFLTKSALCERSLNEHTPQSQVTTNELSFRTSRALFPLTPSKLSQNKSRKRKLSSECNSIHKSTKRGKKENMDQLQLVLFMMYITRCLLLMYLGLWAEAAWSCDVQGVWHGVHTQSA